MAKRWPVKFLKNGRGVGATSLFAVRQRTAKSWQMAKSFFAVCHFFAVRFLVADGKELLCRQLAGGKELADGKLADSSSDNIHDHGLGVLKREGYHRESVSLCVLHNAEAQASAM